MPANEWIESLPVGNGRLLATNQGGVWQEKIQLNEETIWSGKPEKNKDRPDGATYVKQAQELIFNGEYVKAQKLIEEKVMIPHVAHGSHTYQTLGDLYLDFQYDISSPKVENYKRTLDLETAVSSVEYTIGTTLYTREIFSSVPDQAIIIRLSSNQKEKLSFTASFDREKAKIETVSSHLMQVSGVATDKGNDQSGGVAYESQIKFINTGGIISHQDNEIIITNADTVEIRIVAATNYRGDNPHQKSIDQLLAIDNKDYKALYNAHVKEHQRLFNRVQLDLVQKKKIKRLGPTLLKNMPTNQRLHALRQGLDDPELIALYFQFGRYILISCSRPGTMAINLWGKWINTVDPWFNADYHTNINIPMNYWPAQITNLAECQTPFFDLIGNLRENGRKSAKVTYGAKKGFVAHHATDAWGLTATVGRATHGMWQLTPAWGAHQMWQHYVYTLDKEYLQKYTYPIMKEAAEFFVETLVEHPTTGYLVSGPSNSPENTFVTPNGKRVSLSMGTSMDMQMIHDLFANCIKASALLEVDEEFRKTLEKMKARLLPIQVGKDGRLLEWAKPFEETELGHKHCSHFWAFCEGDLITPLETPELAKAAKKSLDIRVENGSAKTPVFRGNTAWIARSYSRLLEGNEAYKVIKYALGSASYNNMFSISVQGLTRKMWETDANLGYTTAIAEMFVQSHAGVVHILPALPNALPDGSVEGLKAEGAFEVGIKWADGKLMSASVKSLKGGLCKLKYQNKKIEVKTIAGKIYEFDAELKAK
ncbi:glycoside hydrolase family 95 protein [Flavivirga amylovorans]